MHIVKLLRGQAGPYGGSVRWPGGWRGLLILGCVAAGAVGGLLLARALAAPDEAGGPASDPGAGVRVQSVVAQLLLREAGLSTRQDPLALTAAEVNAFLADQSRSGTRRYGPYGSRSRPTGWSLAGSRRSAGSSWRPWAPGPGRSYPGRSVGSRSGLRCGARWRWVRAAARSSGRTPACWDARLYPWPCYGGSWAVAPRPWCGECPGSSSGWKASPAASSSIPVREGRAGPRRARSRASGLRAAPG